MISIHPRFSRFLSILTAVAVLAGSAARAQTADTGTGMVRNSSLDANPNASRQRPPAAEPARPATAATRPPAAEAVQPAAEAARPAAEEGEVSSLALYVLAPHDVVEVRVFQEDDLQTTARVAQDGTIKFPLIGSVRVGGKTEDAAAQTIGTELAKDYLVNPQVTLKVVEYAKRRYTVLGQVSKPGTYEMPDRDSITLLEAIGNAGGFTRIANLSDIRLKRIVGNKEMLYKLSAKGMTTRQTSSFEIKSGDIITVGESIF